MLETLPSAPEEHRKTVSEVYELFRDSTQSPDQKYLEQSGSGRHAGGVRKTLCANGSRSKGFATDSAVPEEQF